MIQFHIGGWKNYFFGFSILFLFFIYLLPVYPGMPSAGLDPSWSNTINYALIEDLKFGTDIVFTYGPLGSLRFPDYIYSEKTYWLATFISVALSIIASLALFIISKPVSILTKTIGVLAIFSGLINGGLIFWYLIPILFIVVAVKEKGYKTSLISFLLVAVMAFSILVKFSHFPIVLITVVLADLYSLKNKIKPLFTACLFACFLAFYFISGQELSGLLNYLTGSFLTLSGYSEAMNSFGPPQMIYAFLVIFFAAFSLLLLKLYKNASLSLFTISLVAFLVLFLAFKQGFVRHDAHAISAFSGLSIVFGVLFIVYSRYLNTLFTYGSMLALLFLSIFSSYQVRAMYSGATISHLISSELVRYKRKTLDMPSVFSLERLENLNRQYSEANKRIKDSLDLSGIKGSVDIYPWDQSYVIASGLELRPRPMFQSYSAYTDKLIQSNIDFLKSGRSAENILFKIKEIDGRLPSTMEGASWLEILSRYDAVDLVGDFLHLKKAKSRKEFNLISRDKVEAQLGQFVNVPNYFTFVKIDIEKNLLGKLASIFYKTPILKIQLNFTDGTSQVSRIIPGIVRKGFILTPYISDVSDFYRFSVGNKVDKEVAAFKIINNSSCCYENIVNVSFSEIETNYMNSENVRSDSLNVLDVMYEIQASSTDRALLNIRPYNDKEVLFSHVGTSFKVASERLSKLENHESFKIGYGFFDSAYSNGNRSNGGCFKIYKNKKVSENIIFKSCLNPLENVADRGEHRLKLDVDDSVESYIFEVIPREGFNANWGWSYWSF